MDWSTSFSLAAPEVLLSISALVLLLAAVWAKGEGAARAITWASVATLAVAAVLVAPVLCAGASGNGTLAFSGLFSADALAAFAKLLVFVSAGAALLVSPAWFGRLGAYRAEYPVLVLLAVLGMCLMVSATNLTDALVSVSN